MDSFKNFARSAILLVSFFGLTSCLEPKETNEVNSASVAGCESQGNSDQMNPHCQQPSPAPISTPISIATPPITPTPTPDQWSWLTVDDVLSYSAQGIVKDVTGSLFVSGFGSVDGGPSRWLVRTNKTSVWQTVDDYIFANDTNTRSFGMGLDFQGNLYSLGATVTGAGAGADRWVVRKSVDGLQWSTVDDYQYGNYSAAKGFARSQSGDVFVVGNGYVDGIHHWIVRKSSDFGNSWAVVDDYLYAPGHSSYATKVEVDRSGNIYVIGCGETEYNPNFHWIVRKSIDGGVTWTTIDDYQMKSNEQSYPYGIEIDDNGNIYIAGSGFDGIYSHWIVRKSSDQGNTWATVDDYQYASRLGQANSLAINQLGVVYVVGYGHDGNLRRWITRQSNDGGNSWTNIDDLSGAVANDIELDYDGQPVVVGHTDFDDGTPVHWLVRKYVRTPRFATVDNFSLASGFYASGTAIAADGNGTLYVAGTVSDSSALNWVVRKSSDGGLNWSTVDTYTYPTGYARAQALALAPDGSIYVGGLGANIGGGMYGVVRKSTDGGNSWVTIDTFAISPHNGISNGVNSIKVDTVGNIYVAGSNGKWFVRKSSDGGITWATVDLASGTNALVATAMEIDGSGKIYVAGYGDALSPWTWMVRKSIDGGSTWDTVDSYVHAPGYFAYPQGLAADKVGNVYVVGFEGVYQPGTYYPPSSWIIRKWSVNDNSWSTVDSNIENPANGNWANAVTVDSEGHIYVAGGNSGGGGFYWNVKRSVDGGVSWFGVDTTSGGWGAAAITSRGKNIYVTGDGGLTRIFSQ